MPGFPDFRRAVAAALAFGVASNVAWFLTAGDARHAVVLVIDVVPLLVALPFTIRRGRGAPLERRGWYLLAGSHAIRVGALSVRFAAVTGLLPPGADRVGVVATLASSLVLGAALLAWPFTRAEGTVRRRHGLDAVLFAASLFYILWALGWGELYRAWTGNALDRAFTLLFPTTSIGLLSLAVYLGVRGPAVLRGPLGWLTAFFAAAFVGNVLWGGFALRGAYAFGDPLDLLSHVLPLLAALATFSPRPVVLAGTEPGPASTSWGSLLLPYLPVVPALALAAASSAAGRASEPVLTGTVIAMVGLLLLRQLLALADVMQLTAGLEARVAERTRALEEATSALVKTQRLNLVATLGAGLAHDFKNLLSVIVSSVELARKDVAAGSPPRNDDLEAIAEASARASELASRLVALGRGRGDAGELVDLGALVLGSERLLRAVVRPSIRLELSCSPGLLRVHGDPLALHQVLVNLVSNARDAMPRGGLLQVTVGHDEPGTLALGVRDTGSGMPPEVAARAFEPFFTTKAPGEGTGLGLASVKAIVEGMGGRLGLETAPGAGTTVTVRLPAA